MAAPSRRWPRSALGNGTVRGHVAQRIFFPPGPESAFVGRSLTSRVLLRLRHGAKLVPANRGGEAEVVRPPGKVTVLPGGCVRFLRAASRMIRRRGNSVTSDPLRGGYWGGRARGVYQAPVPRWVACPASVLRGAGGVGNGRE